MTIADGLQESANTAVSFALLGGVCDDFVRFLELEWFSYDQKTFTQEEVDRFMRTIKQYKEYKDDTKRDWHEAFDGRDFTKVVV